MARKKLAEQQLEQLKKLVLEGKTPEDISKYFNIAVSSVHNYKKMLKDQGLEIPDIRGKRPVGIEKTTITPLYNSEALSEVNLEKINESGSFIKVSINNVTFYISDKAQTVSLEKNHLQVRF